MKRSLFAAAVLFLTAPICPAQTWTGATSSDWNDATNWTPTPPAPKGHASIGETGTFQPVISQGSQEELGSVELRGTLWIRDAGSKLASLSLMGNKNGRIVVENGAGLSLFRSFFRGTLILRGANSTFSTGEYIAVGKNARLEVSDGAVGVSRETIWKGRGSISGSRTRWTDKFTNIQRSGRLNIEDGAEYTSRQEVNLAGYLNIDGKGSRWDVRDLVRMALNGRLRIQNGGTAVVRSILGANIHLENGGLLEANRVGVSSSDPIVLDGGILRGKRDSLSFFGSGGAPLILRKDGGTIDTNGFELGIRGPIRGTGGLAKTGNGSLLLERGINSKGPLVVSRGELVFGEASDPGLIAGNVEISNNAKLSGAGVIRGKVNNSGAISPGYSSGALLLRDRLSLTKSSVLVMDIESDGRHDTLSVKNSAKLGGELRIRIAKDFSAHRGQEFVLLDANQLKGSFSKIRTSSLFDIMIENNQVVLVWDGNENYKSAARNQNQRNAADALEKLRRQDFRSGSDFDSVVRAALDQANEDTLALALDEVQPRLSVAFSDSVFARSRTFLPQMQTRLADIREGARGFQASGMQITQQGAADMKDVLAPAPENKWGVWVDGSGVFNQIASFDNLGRGQGTSAAATVGVDYRLSDNFTIGLYTGYVGTWTNFGGGSEVDSNGSRFGLYSTYQNGGFYLNNVIGGEWNSYDWTRSIRFPGINRTARADTNGTVFETMFGGGYDWDITNNFKLGLFSSIEYTLLFVDGFSESGAGSLNLRVNDQDADSLRTNVGAQAMWTLPIGTRTLRPSLRAAWRHEYLDGNRRINSALVGGAGPSFSTNLPGTNRRDSLLLNGGFSMDITDNVSGYVYYTGDLAGGTTDNIHAVNAGLRLQF